MRPEQGVKLILTCGVHRLSRVLQVMGTHRNARGRVGETFLSWEGGSDLANIVGHVVSVR